MIVSDIAEFDKKRSKVYIDGEFAFLLYKGELRDYGIKKDSELAADKYDEIKTELLPKRATKRAMNLLQKKDYTESRLREKLRESLYPTESIDTAIEYVKSYKYIDDERYARDYVTYYMELRSRNRIIQDLTAKGIKKDILMPVIEELYSGEDAGIEQTQIKELLVKRHFSKDMDFKEKQKIIAFLMRRGYSLDAIKRAMDDGK